VTLKQAFDALVAEVDADPEIIQRAKDRRDAFRAAFNSETDVDRTIASGSLARGTQIEPIHDVDLLVRFHHDQHPDWGKDGPSAEDALEHLRERVKALLGPDNIDPDSGIEPVRFTKIRNHAVTCWLDDPKDPNAFTVDVVPVLNRVANGLPAGFWLPERESHKWIASDPLHLIAITLTRHDASNGEFAKRQRILKRFSADRGKLMKGLTMEVMGLDTLPDGSAHQALAGFFAAAETRVFQPITDPANLCGEIEPDLDRQQAADAFVEAAEIAWRANTAADYGNEHKAICLWREIFPQIPEPEGGCKRHLAPMLGGAVAAGSGRRVRDLQQG
jgi:predicted nucleotidyltransferase